MLSVHRHEKAFQSVFWPNHGYGVDTKNSIMLFDLRRNEWFWIEQKKNTDTQFDITPFIWGMDF